MKKLFYLLVLCTLILVACTSNTSTPECVTVNAAEVIDSIEAAADTVVNVIDSLVVDTL